MPGRVMENAPRVESRERIPGLDGLRALAVVAVLLFHLRVDHATGGFLGVSLFFTLSGYLITRLLVNEHSETGTISLTGFWARRLRRLMPAALAVLGGITIIALVSNVFESDRVRGDLWSALGYAANWRFMTASTSYADLFVTTPSPVLHFWSLAIEEQFYFVFPVVLLALFGRSRRAAIVGLAVLWTASVVASLVIGSTGTSDNVVYYGLHTRAAELLTGSLAALLVTGRLGRSVTSRRLWRVSSTLALMVFVVSVISVDTGDRWLYRGGFAAVSLVSIVLVLGIQVPGPLQWIAERRAVVAVGGWSYGLYLVHWPVFLIVSADRTGLDGFPLHILRLLVTVVVTVLISRFIEQPIRQGHLLSTSGRRSGALVLGVAVIAGAVVAVPHRGTPSLAGLEAPDTVVEFGDTEPSTIIAVLGSQAAAAVDMRSVVDAGSVKIVDLTDPACPVTTFAFTVVGCRTLAERLDALEVRPSLVVVGVGASERTLLEPALTAGEAEIFAWAERYVGGILSALGPRESVLLDYGEPDVLAGELEDVGLVRPTVSSLGRPTPPTLADLYAVVATKLEGADRRERVMVIGDSSSFGISAAIDAVAGDRFNVVWAGGQNCPLVDVEQVRWWDGAEFTMDYCPTLDGEWRDLLDSFRPDRVLVVVTVPEQAEQRYAGDPDWHALGDPAYQQVHDAFMAEFMQLLIARDIGLSVFNSPRIHGGSLSGATFAQDDRVDGWNAMIAAWAARWPVIEVIDWAGILARVEPEPGSLRIDGVHLEQNILNGIVAAEIVPLLARDPRSPPAGTIG
ncbi:MAG: acyltransferase family protein [Ilumatobacteraceae bacterium]